MYYLTDHVIYFIRFLIGVTKSEQALQYIKY